MARVFVSYAKSERDLTRAVVALLEAAGHTVWWDTELVSGETYRDALDRERGIQGSLIRERFHDRASWATSRMAAMMFG